MVLFFFFSSRRRHTRSLCDWSSDVCTSDLRRPYEALGDRVEHRLHLAREARKRPDVPDAEAGRASERVREWLRAPGKARPARRVIPEPARPEPAAQLVGEPRDRLALEPECGRDRLTRDVVGRPAEPARDEHLARTSGLDGDDGRDLLEVVANSGQHRHLEAELAQATREPRRVRVLDVARDDLVADRDDDRGLGHGAEVSGAAYFSGNGFRASAPSACEVTQTG